MAEATEELEALAIRQLRATYLEIGALVFTLLATAAAAFAAAMAARATKRAAEATEREANVSEAAFRRLERPYLFVEFESTGGIRKPGQDQTPFIRYRLANYGKLPATLRSIFVELIDNPDVPLRVRMGGGKEWYDVINPGDNLAKLQHAYVQGSQAGFSYVGPQATRLILHGLIQYEDPTGAFHTDRFCMRCNEDANSFRIDGGSEYNWRKTRYPGEPYDPEAN